MNEALNRETDPDYRNILLPLDGSQLAAGALGTAEALAKQFGAVIHAVGVAGSDNDAERLRRHLADVLRTDPGDPRVHVETDEDVAGAIQHRVDELGSCLVCMSTHGRGRVEGALIGSVAKAVIERGHEPVVVAGPVVARPDPWDGTAPPPLGVEHLVACVDGTPASERVIPAAAAWADKLGMRLTIVTVAEPCPPPVRIGAKWRRLHGPEGDADEFMRQLSERWAPVASDARTSVIYDPIGVAEGMKGYLAQDPAGLIAVASHLRAGLDHMVFGSAAADIVRVSSAPALVVPLR